MSIVPVSNVVRIQIEDVFRSAIERENVPRDASISRIAPLAPDDRDLLTTPLCPESCFHLMEADQNARCNPVKPVPAGVEGEGFRRGSLPTRWARGTGRETRTCVR